MKKCIAMILSVVCCSGHAAPVRRQTYWIKASQILIDAGFNEVYNFEGGYAAWQAQTTLSQLTFGICI